MSCMTSQYQATSHGTPCTLYGNLMFHCIDRQTVGMHKEYIDLYARIYFLFIRKHQCKVEQTVMRESTFYDNNLTQDNKYKCDP